MQIKKRKIKYQPDDIIVECMPENGTVLTLIIAGTFLCSESIMFHRELLTV